jgi:hypothetical protein
VHHRLERPEPHAGGILEQVRDEVDSFGRRAGTEDLPNKRICMSVESRSHATLEQTTMQTNLDEWVRLNLRKLVLHVIGIHRLDLLPRGRSQNLDDFHQLVDAALTREQGLAEHQLSHDTTS